MIAFIFLDTLIELNHILIIKLHISMKINISPVGIRGHIFEKKNLHNY
jgi:hypothetical protein